MRTVRFIAVAVIATAAAASTEAGGTDGSSVSFSEDVAPLLKRRCAVCHITGNEPGRMSLVPGRAYENLVGVPSEQSDLLRVQPGDAQRSYLWHKLAGSHEQVGGSGARMPFGAPPLPEEQITLIRGWIEQGAPDN